MATTANNKHDSLQKELEELKAKLKWLPPNLTDGCDSSAGAWLRLVNSSSTSSNLHVTSAVSSQPASASSMNNSFYTQICTGWTSTLCFGTQCMLVILEGWSNFIWTIHNLDPAATVFWYCWNSHSYLPPAQSSIFLLTWETLLDHWLAEANIFLLVDGSPAFANWTFS